MIVYNGNIVVNNGRWIIPHQKRKHDPILGDIVEIGNQWWMSENLAIDDGEGGISSQLINGKLEYRYTREAAMRISSRINGWHLPTQSEWIELFNYVSNGTYNISGSDNHIYDLRSTSGWYNNQNGTNLTGFNAYPTYPSRSAELSTKSALYLAFNTSRDGYYTYGNTWAHIDYNNIAGITTSNYETRLSVRLIKDRAILPYPKYDLNPLKLPGYTFRIRFKQGVTPSTSFSSVRYTQVSAEDNIWDITETGNYKWKLGGHLLVSNEFKSDVIEILGANTQGVIQFPSRLFTECKNLESISTRFDCSSLESSEGTFWQCESLTQVPLLNYYTSCNVNYLFCNCYNVEHGALDLYHQLVNHNNGNHSYTFGSCGRNTQTGSAELAQIPSSWKSSG